VKAGVHGQWPKLGFNSLSTNRGSIRRGHRCAESWPQLERSFPEWKVYCPKPISRRRNRTLESGRRGESRPQHPQAGGPFNVTGGMQGSGIGTRRLSKINEIDIQNASIVSSSQQCSARMGANPAHKGTTAFSEITTEDGHCIFSSASGAGIGTGIVHIRSDVSSSSADAIHVKRSSFCVLLGEPRTGINPGCTSFWRTSVRSIDLEGPLCFSAGLRCRDRRGLGLSQRLWLRPPGALQLLEHFGAGHQCPNGESLASSVPLLDRCFQA
jgi:hypothetical protein